ncbi:MAG: DNA topoisomerase IV subunit A [Desulfurivibrionaceae bacterium]
MDTDYGELEELFDTNFLNYTSYVIRERAIPDIVDGLKPVQRRIIQTLANMDDGRFHKVANVVGETMKLHPHGDQSIFNALVNLANKGYLVDRQGNFGNIFTGDNASAARYIECRLSPLARETLLNRDLTEYVPSYDGRLQEPVALPAKLPFLLLQGVEGIAVGMATRILPHNFCELLQAQKKILNGEEFQIYPDFPQGGIVDVSDYQDGNGRIRSRARLEEKDDKTIIIRDIPYSATTQSLMDSLEKAVKSGRIKVSSLHDYTAEEVEIEIKLPKNVYARDMIKPLYAFTDCEVSITANLTVLRDERPENLTVSEVLRSNTGKLVEDLKKELTIERDRLRENLQAHLLEQIFIEERLYKEIEECSSLKMVVSTVDESLKPFRDRLVRDVTRKDIDRLLEIHIRRISRYDINKKLKEIKDIEKKIRKIEKDLADVVAYARRFIDHILEKYGHLYPRRTEIRSFQGVEVREAAPSNLTVSYSRESGFFGHQVEGGEEFAFSCSEYDRIMIIFKDGSYRITNPAAKVFLGHDLLWAGVYKEDLLFNVIYRDGEESCSYLKRFKAPRFILDREYRLFPEHRDSFIQHLSLGEEGRLRIYFRPSKRARSNYQDVEFSDFLVKGTGARGKRLSTRIVQRVRELKAKDEEKSPRTPPLFPGDL